MKNLLIIILSALILPVYGIAVPNPAAAVRVDDAEFISFMRSADTAGVLTAEELELMSAYPFTFAGHDSVLIPVDVAKGLPKLDTLDVRSDSGRKLFNRMVEYYRSVSLAYVEKCLEIVGEGSDKYNKLMTIRDRMVSKKVDVLDENFYLIGLTRAMACISGSLSAAETELFEYFPSKLLFAMFQKVQKNGTEGFAWELLSDLELMMLVGDFNNVLPGEERVEVESSMGFALSKPARSIIAKEMRKYFACEKAPLFVPGRTHLGITFFVRSILAELYPVALPYPTNNIPEVHGVNMTPLSFAWHDHLHGDFADKRAKAPRNWAGDLCYEFLQRLGGNYREDIPFVVKNAASVYESVRGALTGLVNAAQKRFSESAKTDLKIAKQEYNKVLHAIFYLLHEINVLNDKGLYSSLMLDKGDLGEFFDRLISNAKGYIVNDEENILSGSDLINATENALKYWVLDSLMATESVWNSELQKFVPVKKKWRDIVGDKAFDFEVKKGELLTRFTVEFKDGNILQAVQRSRAYVLSTASDSEWLLKAAGLSGSEEILKPAADCETADFNAYTSGLNTRLCEMMDCLKEFFMQVKDTDPTIVNAQAVCKKAVSNLVGSYRPSFAAAGGVVSNIALDVSGVNTNTHS